MPNCANSNSVEPLLQQESACPKNATRQSFSRAVDDDILYLCALNRLGALNRLVIFDQVSFFSRCTYLQIFEWFDNNRLPEERQLREPDEQHLCTGRETRGNFDDNEYADLPDLVSMSDSDGEEPECEIVD